MSLRKLGLFLGAVAISAALIAPAGAGAVTPVERPQAEASGPSREVFTVCKRGCRYRKIQAAVNASDRNDLIRVKPGKYVEGVIIEGHKHDGLTIRGTGRPRQTILEGKNAQTPDGLAQNGIEATKVNGLRLLNMWARNYVTNGFFIHDGCRGYLMKNLRASFNRAYGMYAFNCIGGRITRSVGWGHGDSAFYIGQTPPQQNPKWTLLDHNKAHTNVLGYSGTNSRYVRITDSLYYNNGVGIVPNTLDSEKFEPSETGIIENNYIFWNNFNYFLPASPVETVSDGLGEVPGLGTIQYPTGAGVVLLGTTNWRVRDNDIFGNFMWGVMTVSNPFNDDNNAIPRGNRMENNRMGRGGTDTNAWDFIHDGSGSGNCWSNNNSSTFDPGTEPDAVLYPSCPQPTGPDQAADINGNFGQIAAYVTTDPPDNQECSWTKHSHPAFRGLKPLSIPGGEEGCP